MEREKANKIQRKKVKENLSEERRSRRYTVYNLKEKSDDHLYFIGHEKKMQQVHFSIKYIPGQTRLQRYSALLLPLPIPLLLTRALYQYITVRLI